MTSPTASQTFARLEATFGLGRDWTSQAGQSATVWETPAYHLLWLDDAASDVELRRLWEARKGRQAYPVVLLAPSGDVNKLRVAGPQDARPVRELPVSQVLHLLETSRSLAAREAASFLAREFGRLEEAVVPGLRVKDLLTPHFMRERLRRPINEQRLSGAVEGIAPTGSIGWRSLFQGMGYQVEQLPQRGYLLRHGDAPVAVVHPHRDASQFSRLTDNGELPEGMVLADCAQHGAHWGVLIAEGRYRLFQRRPPVGPATGQHVEIDLSELERSDRFYLGLLAPESLKEKGWLTDWVGEAKDFGEELRKGLEERLIKDALPNIARATRSSWSIPSDGPQPTQHHSPGCGGSPLKRSYWRRRATLVRPTAVTRVSWIGNEAVEENEVWRRTVRGWSSWVRVCPGVDRPEKLAGPVYSRKADRRSYLPPCEAPSSR